jgi:hypothetical protein
MPAQAAVPSNEPVGGSGLIPWPSPPPQFS